MQTLEIEDEATFLRLLTEIEECFPEDAPTKGKTSEQFREPIRAAREKLKDVKSAGNFKSIDTS